MDRAILERQFPRLVIRNKSRMAQHLQYLHDSLTIQAGAERPVPSKDLLQIPSPFLFQLVKPTLFELEAAGVISLREERALEGEPEPDPVTAPTVVTPVTPVALNKA